MSWSRQYASLGAFRHDKPTYPPTDEDPATLEAVHVARGAAERLLRSGVIGDTNHHDFAISLSGHANPGHVKTPNYANDCVTISISQLDPKPVELVETKPARATEEPTGEGPGPQAE